MWRPTPEWPAPCWDRTSRWASGPTAGRFPCWVCALSSRRAHWSTANECRGRSLQMRTMVTGGAGFIGSTLVDRLLVEGHEVDVIDDFSTGSLANLADARGSAGRALTIHHLDITAPAVIDLMVRRRPELVFHLAAQADVRVSVARPAFDAEVNIVGSLNILEGARRAESERVIFAASGGTLYGDPAPEDLPVREAHPHQPLSPYGVSKKSVLDYLVAYRELHALELSG